MEETRKPVRILVVDDDLPVRDAIKILLKHYDYAVDSASNGREAVEKVRTTRYDMVLMGIELPVMDGFEATRVIRNEISKKLPIIGLTISPDKKKCLASGMDGCINKPFDIQERRFKKQLLTWIGSDR